MGRELQIGEFFGAVRQRRDLGGVVVTELSHPGEKVLPEHTHAAPYFCLLPFGSYVEEVEGRSLEYEAFSVGFHPPVPHRDRIGRKGAVFFFIEIRPEWLHAAAALLPSDPDLEPRLLDADLSCLATRLYRSYAEETLGPETTDSALWELVGCLERGRRIADRAKPRWLASCVDILHADLARPLTVLEVATTLGVHPVHLSREFRKRYGETMGEYLHKLRVRAACDALKTCEKPLADVALDTGFSDQSHFCRVFKSLIGCSPGHFRRVVSERQGQGLIIY